MKFIASVDIMPHPELLDPQGKATMLGLKNLNIQGVDDVRIGKHITLTLEADSEAAAKEQVDTACKKLLSNPIMENYVFELKKIA